MQIQPIQGEEKSEEIFRADGKLHFKHFSNEPNQESKFNLEICG